MRAWEAYRTVKVAEGEFLQSHDRTLLDLATEGGKKKKGTVSQWVQTNMVKSRHTPPRVGTTRRDDLELSSSHAEESSESGCSCEAGEHDHLELCWGEQKSVRKEVEQ